MTQCTWSNHTTTSIVCLLLGSSPERVGGASTPLTRDMATRLSLLALLRGVAFGIVLLSTVNRSLDQRLTVIALPQHANSSTHSGSGWPGWRCRTDVGGWGAGPDGRRPSRPPRQNHCGGPPGPAGITATTCADQGQYQLDVIRPRSTSDGRPSHTSVACHDTGRRPIRSPG